MGRRHRCSARNPHRVKVEEEHHGVERIFPRSRVVRVSRYPDEGREIHGRAAGSVMTVELELDGHPFTALNGGPHFKLTPAVSFQVMCETQDEIDRYWSQLSAGGDEKARQCGWLADKFGLS